MKWMKRIDRKYLRICIYVVCTVVAIQCLSLITGHASEIFDWIMIKTGWILNVLEPVVIGFVLAYLTRPINDFFERQYIKVKFLRKKARGFSTLTTMFFLFAIVVSIITALVFSITNQLQLVGFDEFISAFNQLIQSLNDFYKSLMDKLGTVNFQSEQITTLVENISAAGMNLINGFVNGLFISVSNVSGYIATLTFGIIIGIYFMLDGKMITTYLSRASKAIFSEKAYNKIKNLLLDLHMVFSGYIRGQLTDVLFMMVALSLVLLVVGVKLAPLIGILAGLGNLIPYVGPFIAYAGIILVCLVNGQYQTMIIAILAVLVVQVIDANIIEPKFLSKSIQIHPLLVIVFLIFGSAVGGLFGMLLAVPIGGFAKLLFVRFIENCERKKEAVSVPEITVEEEENE